MKHTMRYIPAFVGLAAGLAFLWVTRNHEPGREPKPDFEGDLALAFPKGIPREVLRFNIALSRFLENKREDRQTAVTWPHVMRRFHEAVASSLDASEFPFLAKFTSIEVTCENETSPYDIRIRPSHLNSYSDFQIPCGFINAKAIELIRDVAQILDKYNGFAMSEAGVVE